MTRLFIGWKNASVGGVIKIMKNDADNPLTTPNTDYGKFLFNSETAAIGYGEFSAGQAFTPRTLTYPSTVYYPPGSTAANANFITDTGTFGIPASQWNYREIIVGNNAYPIKNAFHFAMDDTAEYRYVWSMSQEEYQNSSDARTISARRFPVSRPTPFLNGATWSIAYLSGDGGNGFSGTSASVPAGARDRIYARIITENNAWPGVIPAATKISCYYLDLPVNNSPYPAVSPGTPVSGQKMVRIERTLVKMAKAGYNVDTATDAQCIFTSDKIPMKVIKTGIVNVNAGATINVPMGRTLSQSTFVDYQINIVGGNVWVPPWPDSSSRVITAVRYRFNGTDLQLNNTSTLNLQVRYVVMAQDDLAASTGTAKILDANFSAGTITLRRPGSAGTRLSDTILSSDLAYLPVVAEDWVPITNFVASNTPQIGNRMHRITLSNPGGLWKPYVQAKLACRLKSDTTKVYYMDPFGKSLDNTSRFAASNFMIRIEGDAAVTFYCSDDNRDEDAYRTGSGVSWTTTKWDWEPIGLRYYIFAIPNAL